VIITQTPLRVSLAGGGTDLKAFYDLEPGRTISLAIDKYVFVIVSQRFDAKIYVNYTRKEIVDHVDELQHELVREAMRITGLSNGVEVTMLADIPSEGSGLGSSSSLTVGLLNAFHMYEGRQVTAEQLAREACQIEIDICGKPIGKQDQYIAAYGGIHEFEYRADGTVGVRRIKVPPADCRRLGAELMLFYTDITRRHRVVRIHEQHPRPLRRQHAGLDGIALAPVREVLEHPQIRKRRLIALRHRPRVVPAAIADHHDLAGIGLRLQIRDRRFQRLADPVAFVVGRNDDRKMAGRIHGPDFYQISERNPASLQGFLLPARKRSRRPSIC
jgi:hypothetical protein